MSSVNEQKEPGDNATPGVHGGAQRPQLHSSFGGVLAPFKLGENLVRAFVLEPRQLQSSAANLSLACMSQFVRDPSCYAVRAVPGVMFQIMLPADEDIEMRLHVYVASCEETYIHNHTHLFSTYGVYGAYEERLWRVSPAPDDCFYQFRRYKSGQLSEPVAERGSLRLIKRRYQFEGNCLVVEPEAFHSIAPMPGSPAPITLIIRSKRHSSSRTTVLSATSEVSAPTIPIRAAQQDEVAQVQQRLQLVLDELKQRSGDVQ